MKDNVIKSAAVFLCILFLQINISGCAGNQTGTRKEARDRDKGRWDELIVETPVITPKAARSGEKIKQELKFTLLSAQEGVLFNVSETVLISDGSDTIEFELTKKESRKAQGIYKSIVQFLIPKDLSAGEYRLITIISAGKEKKSVSGNFRVK